MLEQIFSMIFTTSFGYSIIRITSPILFAALAAVVAEKAGVTNIGLEGIMMISALFGVLFAYWTSYWWVGVIGAVVVGIILALIIGVFALKLKTDIILAGIAINLVGSGGTIFLLYLFTGLKGNTASLTTPGMLTPKIDIPILESIPILGPIFSGHSILTYVAFILVLLVWILLYKTAIGLQIRAVGENSHAADSVGISVLKIQYIALGISGALSGLGGTTLRAGIQVSLLVVVSLLWLHRRWVRGNLWEPCSHPCSLVLPVPLAIRWKVCRASLPSWYPQFLTLRPLSV